MRTAGRALLALGVCACGGALFAALGTVLPWMLGAMLFMATASIAGWPVLRPPGGLPLGQLVVGMALGLYFTAPVLHELLHHAGAIAAGALFALALGCGSAALLARLSGCDYLTAFFASLPGGAGEMSVMADRMGGRADWVAAAHALRIMIVVLSVPPLITWSGAHGAENWLPATRAVHYPGLALLALAACSGALLLRAFNTPNGWIIGPLLVTIALTGSGLEWSALPRWMVNGGQVLIGCALGSRFSAGFFRTAPRFLLCVAFTVVLSICVAAAFGAGLAWVTGLNTPTTLLATAPGGVAEMSLTASALHLGVPLVTSFHVTRMVFLVLSAAPLFTLGRRWAGRAGRSVSVPQ
ncbi:MAG TPA: AbrB family transcriptional regulator [Ideonella sp.]|nr:AbrB family transcriptional regulator [Ideonella sp.]